MWFKGQIRCSNCSKPYPKGHGFYCPILKAEVGAMHWCMEFSPKEKEDERT